MRNHYFRQIDLLLCTLYSVNTIHTNSAVSVIEVIYQFVQNNNFSTYVISQLSHMHIHIHTRIRLSDNSPLIIQSGIYWKINKTHKPPYYTPRCQSQVHRVLTRRSFRVINTLRGFHTKTIDDPLSQCLNKSSKQHLLGQGGIWNIG